jgi:gliding motility-associated-like protein
MKVKYTLDESGLRTITWTDMKTNNVVDNDTMLSTSDTSLYQCMVVDTFGCVGYDTIKLQKNPEVIASVQGVVICYGDEATLTADVTGGGNAQYLWYDGTKLMGGSRIFKVKPLATTDYWLKVQETKNGVTCKDSTMVRVRVNPLPVIKISAIDKRCINGSIISLNNFVTVNGNPTNIGVWTSPNSGGLIYGDKFNPIAAGVSTPPGWKVRFAYTDPATGCYNKDSSYVTIYALPKPYAGKDDSICTGAKISLTGAPLLPPGTWKGTGVEGSYPNWKFNPDAIGIINGGTYPVIYHYTDNNTCENEDTVMITVYKTPIVEAGNPKEFCVDANSITLTGDPAGGIWTGKGIAGNIFYPSLAQAGVHDLTYTYTNVICTVFDKVKYTVWDLPVVTAATMSGRTKFCRTEGLIQLNGQPTGAGGIWTGPGITGNNFNTAIGADAETDYSLRYEYTDVHKCKSKSDLLVKVRPEPTVTIDPAMNKLCFGVPYQVKATYNHANKVQWWQGAQSDGIIQGQTDSAIIGYNPGMGDQSRLYFWLFIKAVQNDGLCPEARDSIQVLMSAMPVPDFTGDPTAGCTPLQVQFTDLTTINPGTIKTWEWNFGDGNMSGDKDPLHIYQRPGRYTVKLKAISDAGCEKEITKPEYIESYIVPTANFIPKPSLALLSVPTIAFQNMTTNETPSTEYAWNFADWDQYNPGGGTSKVKNPSYKYSDTGHYNVRLIVSNEYGCSDTAYREVVILEDVSVYIPNAFTPDNTGPVENNVFRVVPKGIESFEIRIFDRWGQLVYESNDYETHGWPGTYLGSTEPAPMDVYIYVVKVKGLDGIDYKYSGSVSLLR